MLVHLMSTMNTDYPHWLSESPKGTKKTGEFCHIPYDAIDCQWDAFSTSWLSSPEFWQVWKQFGCGTEAVAWTSVLCMCFSSTKLMHWRRNVVINCFCWCVCFPPQDSSQILSNALKYSQMIVYFWGKSGVLLVWPDWLSGFFSFCPNEMCPVTACCKRLNRCSVILERG